MDLEPQRAAVGTQRRQKPSCAREGARDATTPGKCSSEPPAPASGDEVRRRVAYQRPAAAAALEAASFRPDAIWGLERGSGAVGAAHRSLWNPTEPAPTLQPVVVGGNVNQQADFVGGGAAVELSFELTEADVVAPQRWFLLQQGPLRVFLVAPVVGMLGLWAMGGEIDPRSWVFLGAVLLAAMALYFWAPRRTFRNLPLGQRRQLVRLDEQQVEVAGAAFTTRLAWSAVPRAVALPDALLLFTGPALFFVVPKRAFANPEAFASCCAWVVRSVKPAPKPRVSRLTWMVLIWAAMIVVFFTVYAFSNGLPVPPSSADDGR